ncbi:ketopantoate reductase family protein [Lutibacter flavus]|uniref:2-dehydropantoate 2-reductase n=1 Tax=Lutibacter flavus TaxID=691689 RepID=A0A238X860_9FLAO|nr:2-dehydropantoate 2-reductase [Lutibacter flavus]SNR55216.1 ketopantoate reductase [Lutibacter flavus]
MNIVIYGTGGVGGYFGTRLVQAGNNVTFIARGRHLEAIQKNGVQLKSIKGDYLVKPANATASISEVKDIDLILICVKTWQLAEVAKQIKPVLNDNTMVISLLNGADNAAILCNIIDAKHVLGGLCKVISKVEDFGIINHISYEPTIIFGELNNEKTKRAHLLERTFLNAGIKTELAEDIQVAIWTKFLFISTISAIGALTRATLGEMIIIPEIKKMMRKTAEEIAIIAKAKGVNLPEDTIDNQFKIIESQPYDATSSLQRDVLDGKPSELEAQNGAIVKMGIELEIPTPVNDFIYYSLLPQEKRARK